jgi:ribonucleoside-diphosphate reductase beta chain
MSLTFEDESTQPQQEADDTPTPLNQERVVKDFRDTVFDLWAANGFRPAGATSVEAGSARRVNASDKRMINATTDVNQLVPFKYKWAWDAYLKACENNWMPQETSLENDANQLALDVITTDECLAIERSLAALTSGDVEVGRVAMGIYRIITAPEARQYLLRQGMEEILTSHVYAHVAETLQLNTDVISEQRQMPTQIAKHVYLKPYVDTLIDVKFRTGSFEADQQFLKAMIVYTCAMKGLFSVSDFAQILALGQKKKMLGLTAIYQKMLRDQLMQVNFGIEVINAIKVENPRLWTPEFKEEVFALILQAFELEKAHAMALGFPAEFAELLQSVVGRIGNQIGIASRSVVPANFNWLGAIMGLVNRRETSRSPAEEKKVSTTLEW